MNTNIKNTVPNTEIHIWPLTVDNAFQEIPKPSNHTILSLFPDAMVVLMNEAAMQLKNDG